MPTHLHHHTMDKDLLHFLQKHDLATFFGTKQLKKLGIDSLGDLRLVTAEDLKSELGLKVVQCRKVMKAIGDLSSVNLAKSPESEHDENNIDFEAHVIENDGSTTNDEAGGEKAEDQTVHYGFICPECKAEFANSDLLNKHFNDKHMEQEEDDEPAPPTHRGIERKPSGLVQSVMAVPQHFYNEQELGVRRLVTDIFAKTREEWRAPSRAGIRPNLIVIAKRLVHEKSPKGMKRKAFEQTVVPWVKDSDHPNCNDCGTAFKSGFSSLVNSNRHHCRICGNLTCSDCCKGLRVDLMTEIISFFPAVSEGPIGGQDESNRRCQLLPVVIDDEMIRACTNCSELLLGQYDAWKHRIEFLEIRDLDAASPPPVSHYHQQLMDSMNRILEVVPQYNKIVQLLYQGEARSMFDKAKDLYAEYNELYPKINGIRGKILKLPARKGNRGDTILQKHIHIATGEILQQIAFGVPKLPSVEEVNEMQEVRNQLYASDLVRAQQTNDIVKVFRIWENQRWTPFRGFKPTLSKVINLSGRLQVDPLPYNTVFKLEDDENEQNSFAHRLLDAVNPIQFIESVVNAADGDTDYHRMRTRGFPSLDSVVPFAGTKFEPDSYWSVAVDPDQPDVTPDTQKWYYHTAFIPRGWKGDYNRMKHYVRRRMWIRAVALTEDPARKKSIVQRPKSMEPVNEYYSQIEDSNNTFEKKNEVEWMHDDDVDKCTRCLSAKFTFLNRKHHCRFCGWLVCDDCSKRKKYYDPTKTLERCCDACFKQKEEIDESDSGGSHATKDMLIWENQRHKFGWKKTTIPDRQPFTYNDGDGKSNGEDFLEAIKPEPGYKWLSTKWFPLEPNDGDDEGWHYAGGFWDNALMPFQAKYNRALHYTRRRQLVRKMEKLSDK